MHVLGDALALAQPRLPGDHGPLAQQLAVALLQRREQGAALRPVPAGQPRHHGDRQEHQRGEHDHQERPHLRPLVQDAEGDRRDEGQREGTERPAHADDPPPGRPAQQRQDEEQPGEDGAQRRTHHERRRRQAPPQQGQDQHDDGAQQHPRPGPPVEFLDAQSEYGQHTGEGEVPRQHPPSPRLGAPQPVPARSCLRHHIHAPDPRHPALVPAVLFRRIRGDESRIPREQLTAYAPARGCVVTDATRPAGSTTRRCVRVTRIRSRAKRNGRHRFRSDDRLVDVGEGGFEPPRPEGHWHLKPARLPFRHSPEQRPSGLPFRAVPLATSKH